MSPPARPPAALRHVQPDPRPGSGSGSGPAERAPCVTAHGSPVRLVALPLSLATHVWFVLADPVPGRCVSTPHASHTSCAHRGAPHGTHCACSPFGPPVPSRTGTSVSCLALAEPHSSPLVAFLSGRLLSPARGDRLSVGLPTAAAASRAQQQASRRFLAALQEGILGERGRVDTRGEGGGGRRVTRAACHPTLGAHARTCVTAVHGTRELDPGLPRSLAHAPWRFEACHCW